ncbi:MAG: hypothetical protein GC160_14905 [Acidobacteria bacterium]|nr:hypothetical protein [Acidobacteriota bacterium]
MKARRWRKPVWAAVAVALAFAVSAWVQTTTPRLTALMPAGALLTLEARDFATLLADWNGSPEKAAWLASDNYQVFSRSKLFVRLREAQDELTAAAGLPALDTAQLLRSVAGGRSALALYDVGDLRFLYITELPQARAVENALWQARASFEPRNAGGQAFYVRRSDETGREAAFAVAGERLLLATSADLMAGALERLAGGAGETVAQEAWYADSAAAATAEGEVRLTYDLRTLTRTSHFRSYWLPQNITELAAFRAGVADLERSADGIRERRVLLRQQAGDAPPETQPAGRLLRLASPEAGFARAWARPDVAETVQLLRDKLLAPNRDPYARYSGAPSIPGGDSQTGSEGDLETRIDQPPPPVERAEFGEQVLRELLTPRNLQGALLTHRGSEAAPWPGHEVGLALEAQTPWPVGETLAALTSSAAGLWTVSGVGAGWAQDGPLYQLNGLKPLFAAFDGTLLLLSDDRAVLESMLARRAQPVPSSQAAVIAEWRRAGFEDAFEALFSRLEHQSSGGFGGPGREPFLFSENIASLSRALGRVGSVRVERTEGADRRDESVYYAFD